MGILWGDGGIYKTVTVDWAHADGTSIAAGTPMGIDGKVHNDQYAIGLTITKLEKNWDGKATLLIAGFVDASALSVTLNKAAKKAMHSVYLVTDGVIAPIPDDNTTYTLPAAAANKLGGVKLAEAVADATDETIVTQFNALLASLVASGALAESSGD